MKDRVFEIETIAVVQSDFKERFGIPRQPSQAKNSKAVIRFEKGDQWKSALKAIEGFSHLWIVFIFHKSGSKSWKPTIRPPRLGGREKVGVLASRSPHRPNFIGLSAVKLDSVDLEFAGGPRLLISGHDLLDGTPVVDVKPYLSYTDSIVDSQAGWAELKIEVVRVVWSEESLKAAKKLKVTADDRNAIEEILGQDPRTVAQKRKYPFGEKVNDLDRPSYGIRILDFEIKYTFYPDRFVITDVQLFKKISKKP